MPHSIPEIPYLGSTDKIELLLLLTIFRSDKRTAQICSSHDIEGVEYLKVCCVAEWGTCGGTGCKTRSEAVGLTADDCCTQRILDSGVYCDDSGAAPCIAGPGKPFELKSIAAAGLTVVGFHLYVVTLDA